MSQMSVRPETLVSNYVRVSGPNYSLTLPSGVHQWFQVLFAPHLPLVIVITLDESFLWITGVGIILRSVGTTPPYMGAIRCVRGAKQWCPRLSQGAKHWCPGLSQGAKLWCAG